MVTDIKIKKVGLLCIWVLGMGGCAGVISSDLVKASRPQAPFTEIRSTPQDHLGRNVVLGGSILNVKKEGTVTVVEVLQRPLGHHLQPEMGDDTGGRFLARIEAIDKKNKLEPKREITVAGKVTDETMRPLDFTTYTYPVIQVEEYHLWPKWKQPSPPRVNFYGGASGSF
ncbi:starvation-inducible outer membrane lipoprotein [Nitrospina gracilis]|uniref:Slp family lipoprotein n=2 Tax=Nitrospina TaxID=35800 RepID=UPI001F43BE70|nr:starvation-inducible outer membrane lipoprotein [Nitrospina sp. Nb-3]